MTKKSLILIDFEDSFSANLAEVFFSLGHDVKPLHWSKLEVDRVKEESDLLVLGPGPGHISDYGDILEKVTGLRDFPVLGICLGHQFMASALGLKLAPLKKPLHGKALNLRLSGGYLELPDLSGQFYNSWCIPPHEKETFYLLFPEGKIFLEHDMCTLIHLEKWVSCQFHPESVGTSFPERTMESLLQKIV